MKEFKDEYCCKVCGRKDFVAEQEWVNQSRCYNCKNIRDNSVLKYSLSKKQQGLLCEDFVLGMSKKDLSIKYEVYYPVINEIMNKYFGVGEQPVTLRFEVPEDVVGNIIPYPVGRRVRIISKSSKINGSTKEIVDVKSTSKGYSYKLKYGGNLYYSHNSLEMLDTPKETYSFNIC